MLWISTIRWPIAPHLNLDPSWQATLVHGHAENWQFGRDIVFTHGPWGFLFSHHHLGQTSAAPRIVWECLGQLTFALCMVALIRQVAPWRCALLVGAIALLHSVFPEGYYFLFIVLVITQRLLRSATSLWPFLLWALPLGFLAHVKFTYAVLVLVGGVLAAGLAVQERRRRNAGAIVASIGAAFAFWWMAGGQSLQHLPAYVATGFELMLGYDAMGFEAGTGLLLAGLGVAGSCGYFLWRVWHHLPGTALRWAVVSFLALHWFVVWKHAFTRADEHHLPGFFLLTLYLAVLLPSVYFEARRFDAFDITVGFCAAVLWLGTNFETAAVVRAGPGRWAANIMGLVTIPKLSEKWNNELENARRRYGMAASLKEQIGGRSIDVYNFNQAWALLAPLNFTPRPVFQSYFAYTPALSAVNVDSLASARAPDFFLWRQTTIDGRFPTQDDAALFPLIRHLYRPVETMADYVLLEKRREPRPQVRFETAMPKRIMRFGEAIKLPESVAGSHLWLKVTAKPSWLGRLRAFFYQPAVLSIVTEDEKHGLQSWRVLSRIADTPGFLLQPLLTDTDEFVRYIHDAPFPSVRRFGLHTPEGQHKYWAKLQVELLIAPRAATASEPPATSPAPPQSHRR